MCSFNENGWSNIHSLKIATNCQILERAREAKGHTQTKKRSDRPVDEEGLSSLSDLLTSRNSYANITLIESKLSVVFNRKMANNTFIIVASHPIQFKQPSSNVDLFVFSGFIRTILLITNFIFTQTKLTTEIFSMKRFLFPRFSREMFSFILFYYSSQKLQSSTPTKRMFIDFQFT